MLQDVRNSHHHSGELHATLDHNTAAAPIESQANDANMADCLHCFGMHAPLFALTQQMSAFRALELAQPLPALVLKLPPAPLGTNFRPPIYS